MNIVREKCSAISSHNFPCEDLATSEKHEVRFSSLLISAMNDRNLLTFMLNLIENNCFITNKNEVHCTLCHKTVSRANTSDYLSSTDCSIDFFHEENCLSLENGQDTSFVKASSIYNQHERVASNMQEVTKPKYRSETNIDNLTVTSVLPSSRSYLSFGSSDDKIFTIKISNRPSLATALTNSQKKQRPNPQKKQQRDHDYNTTRSIKYPYYTRLEERISSFLHWPCNKNQTGLSMALAGWVYSDHKDITFCYFCGGKVQNWKEQKPWGRHIEMYPKCVYVNIYNGTELLENRTRQLSL